VKCVRENTIKASDVRQEGTQQDEKHWNTKTSRKPRQCGGRDKVAGRSREKARARALSLLIGLRGEKKRKKKKEKCVSLCK